MDRLNRLDAMEKGEQPCSRVMKDKADEEKKPEEEKDDERNGRKERKNACTQKGEYSDVISSDYLNWMENTLKSAGVDTRGCSDHFDDLEKANLVALTTRCRGRC